MFIPVKHIPIVTHLHLYFLHPDTGDNMKASQPKNNSMMLQYCKLDMVNEMGLLGR